jgi:hypothetical protein
MDKKYSYKYNKGTYIHKKDVYLYTLGRENFYLEVFALTYNIEG